MAAAAVKALQLRGHREPELSRPPAQVAQAELEAAAVVVAVNRAEHEPVVTERFPVVAAKVVYWSIPSGGDSIPTVEREVSNFVARLLGGSDSPAGEPESKTKPAKATTVRVGRETKGRKGKGVTIISDLPLDEEDLQTLATTLKGRCGTGGTVKDGRIEIQGDQRDRLAVELEKLGYRVKRVGG